jgi:hypothetical protein
MSMFTSLDRSLSLFLSHVKLIHFVHVACTYLIRCTNLITLPSCLLYRKRFDELGKKIKRESDATYQMGRRHMLGPPGTLNTITPCAACKLLRRRCAQECPFSPYFSPHEPQKFASVHKVFGASNVSKMLMVKPLCPNQL